ncbi:MAG: hypothetical protein IPP51_07780 [Bacteroidetes bacterium]|nr:hypothetical protein [Bacteroidota bacterium]
MKSGFLLCLLLFFLTPIFAQEAKAPITNYLLSRGYVFPDSTNASVVPDSLKKWPDTLYYNTVYRARLLGSPTIPISFSKIEHINGKYEVSPTISIGYGYTWFTGDFIFNENDKITIDPVFFFGVIGDIGLQNDFSLKKLASVFTGVFVGFGQFSLFAGYDYLSHSPTIGLGGRIDLFTVSQNYLKPIGKVRETRRHKSVALPISDE